MQIDNHELNVVRQAHGKLPGLGIGVRHLVKRFGERQVLHGLDLDIAPGEFIAIVGRSGCGKSTLLRLLAGLDGVTDGEIRLDGQPAATLKDDVRMMFQDARLLPWRTVIQNISIGLAGRPAAIRERALEVLGQVGLMDRADEWPKTLSGGQRQRVALARALIHRPRLLLLDEPLGALDALTRIEMQRLIERLWRQHRFTALLVTHDVSEAVALGDRIVLVEEGRITLDEGVGVARPREHGDQGFAALESRVLKRIMTVTAVNEPSPIRGRVARIRVDHALSEVLIETEAGLVAATVPTRSLSGLPLAVGAEVLATFKSNEVVLATA